MSFNLRIPPALDIAARARADALGISLNAIVLVAMDAYLRASLPLQPLSLAVESDAKMTPKQGQNDASPLVITGITANNPLASAPGPNATKKERQAYTAFQRSQRKLPL